MQNKISVLDHGYIILQDHMGDDKTAVNAARVSYNKQAEYETTTTDIDDEPEGGGWERTTSHFGDWSEWRRLKPRDQKLLKFLAENEHTSPFRHAMLQFECYEPLMVARQHWKYRVGSSSLEENTDFDTLEAWNESSRRYITEEPVFYRPKVWFGAPTNKKQGSGDPVASWGQQEANKYMEDAIEDGLMRYHEAVHAIGIAPEQARLFLPAYAMYVRFYWTVSLFGLIHFIRQRIASDAQHEITEYAWAFWQLGYQIYPRSFEAFGLGAR